MIDRRQSSRRDLDKMDRKIQLIADGQAALSSLLNTHLVECAKNSRDLKESVNTVVEWAQPQIQKAKAKAETWEKIKSTVFTDGMVTVLKWGPLFVVVAIFFGSVPAVKWIFKVLGGG